MGFCGRGKGADNRKVMYYKGYLLCGNIRRKCKKEYGNDQWRSSKS